MTRTQDTLLKVNEVGAGVGGFGIKLFFLFYNELIFRIINQNILYLFRSEKIVTNGGLIQD